MANRQAHIDREGKMNAYQTVSHVASYALDAYVMYFGISTLAFAAYVWKNVYANVAHQENSRAR
jgi:hypothetical protein